MFKRFRKNNEDNGRGNGHQALIDLQQIVKAYDTPTGDFLALKNIDLQVNRGEFVAVIGKSGSGKTTLINMITGIDKPTSGHIFIDDQPIHNLGEGPVAQWRGLNVGVVFQFFQLLPTLSNVENVMLPMDFCNTFKNSRERQERALHLLDLVEIKEHAFKKPSEISGGQQQRVAIARALANDPPIIVADEPTGNLDSKTANAIFDLFEKLLDQGKTIFMVTHDKDAAQRVNRTIILSDGEIIDEYSAEAFPMMAQQHLLQAAGKFPSQKFAPGTIIVAEGETPEKIYIVQEGALEVLLREPDGSQIAVARLKPGQYFGEIALLRGGSDMATVIADPGHDDTAVLISDQTLFNNFLQNLP